MTISGFTMVRNAGKYYFPIKACIESALPLVDEFIVALGDGDEGDDTLAQIESINSPKIKIFHRKWDEQLFKDGAVFRAETTFALQQCKGDWCLYLQADEVLHEKDFASIKSSCEKYLNDKRVEGMLFNYHHFFGDYKHVVRSHGWCSEEIRIVRNGLGIESYKDAISFRLNDRKLKVVEIPVSIFHYGWVRPPALMVQKRKEQDSMHHGKESAQLIFQKKAKSFDYGPLGQLELFENEHPAVMKYWIAKHNWKDDLNYGKSYATLNRPRLKHEQLRYRIQSFFENRFMGGKQLFGFENWERL
jgi:hypothetical protein